MVSGRSMCVRLECLPGVRWHLTQTISQERRVWSSRLREASQSPFLAEENMDAYSNKHKHLEFIQAAVNRMSGNLFLLKGWSITLIAALFALAAKDSNQSYILIAYFPLFIFWSLDGYFLSQERRFRALFDHVRVQEESIIDFSMDTRPFASAFRNTWLGSMSSQTLVIYYLGLAAVMLILLFLVR
jgi:hypothetical protein